MTSAPLEPRPQQSARPDASDVAGDAAANGPAQTTGEPGTAQTPPGYPEPEEGDAAEGPLAGRDPALLGDLAHPGAPEHHGPPRRG
ncbi:hypothetical protein [Kineococcus sp. SYSU DK005]|uniref:hypothetical protein n=1 Tax=Kineococcus sp. SYSU DK005 TaxID=3383126 RepID=UPI003D7E9609